VQDNLRVQDEVEASHFYARGIGEVKTPDITDGNVTFPNQEIIGFNPLDFYLSSTSIGGVVVNVEGNVGGAGAGNACFTHQQGAAAVEWSVIHNLNTPDLVTQVFDSNDRLIQADEVDTSNKTTAFFYFAEAQAGKAVIVSCGGIGGSGVQTHVNLAGLDADDHTQYSLADGSRAYTGTLQGNLGVDQAVKAEAFYLTTGGDWSEVGLVVKDVGIDLPDGAQLAPALRHDGMPFGAGMSWDSAGSAWRFRIAAGGVLSINGTGVGIIGNTRISNGTAVSPGLTFSTENTGLFISANELLGFSVGAVERMTLGIDGLNVPGRSRAGGFYLHPGAQGIGRTLNEDIINFNVSTVDVENYWLENFVEQGLIIDDVHIIAEGGTCTVGFYILAEGERRPGVGVAGLDPFYVANTKRTAKATGANVLSENDSLVMSVHENSSATNLRGRVRVKLSG
jgi:hypothetical protein